MKETIKEIKEKWKDPKWHALMVLGVYAIFFSSIYLYIMISSNTKNIEPVYKTPLEKFNQMNNYKYELEISGEIIEGFVTDDRNTFSYQEIEYTYNENVPYSNIIYYTNTKNIYNLIHNQEIYSKTEYNDKRINKVYKLENIEITTSELNEQIDQIEIKMEDNQFKITYQT